MALAFWRNLRLAVTLFVILGLGYSLLLVGIGQEFFPYQAQGSLMVEKGQVVGSSLIGQEFSVPGLFHSRPSATVNAATGRPEPYNADNSSGSNLGPTSPALLKEIRTNMAFQRGQVTGPMPGNLVESSASGLDPEITLQAALAQVPAIARQTGIARGVLRNLVLNQAQGPFLGLYGPWRVNVLKLNLAVRQIEGR